MIILLYRTDERANERMYSLLNSTFIDLFIIFAFYSPCLDTCDAATSILSAELLKVHLKSELLIEVEANKEELLVY